MLYDNFDMYFKWCEMEYWADLLHGMFIYRFPCDDEVNMRTYI